MNTSTSTSIDITPTRAKNVNVKANGLSGFWDFRGDFVHQKIVDALALVGMGHRAPKHRTMLASLKVALAAAHPTRGHVGHALITTRDGYTVIEHRTDDATREVEKPVNVCKAWLEKEPQTGALMLRVEDCLDPANTPALHASLKARMDVAQSNVDSTSVSEALVEAARELGGLSLRSKGGVYWIPESAVAEWNRLADAVEGAVVSGGFAGVYSMTTVGDARTVRAIVASFTREVDAKIAEVEERLSTGIITQEQAQKEARELIDLAALAEHYEGVLGTTLDTVKERIGEVQFRASQVTTLALSDTPTLAAPTAPESTGTVEE